MDRVNAVKMSEMIGGRDDFDHCQSLLCSINACCELQHLLKCEMKSQAKLDHVMHHKMASKARRLQQHASTAAVSGAPLWLPEALGELGRKMVQLSEVHRLYGKALCEQCDLVQKSMDGHHVGVNAVHSLVNSAKARVPWEQHQKPSCSVGGRGDPGLEGENSFTHACCTFEGLRRDRLVHLNRLDYTRLQQKTVLEELRSTESEVLSQRPRGDECRVQWTTKLKSQDLESKLEFLHGRLRQMNSDLADGKRELDTFDDSHADELQALICLFSQHKAGCEHTLRTSFQLLKAVSLQDSSSLGVSPPPPPHHAHSSRQEAEPEEEEIESATPCSCRDYDDVTSPRCDHWSFEVHSNSQEHTAQDKLSEDLKTSGVEDEESEKQISHRSGTYVVVPQDDPRQQVSYRSGTSCSVASSLDTRSESSTTTRSPRATLPWGSSKESSEHALSFQHGGPESFLPETSPVDLSLSRPAFSLEGREGAETPVGEAARGRDDEEVLDPDLQRKGSEKDVGLRDDRDQPSVTVCQHSNPSAASQTLSSWVGRDRTVRPLTPTASHSAPRTPMLSADRLKAMGFTDSDLEDLSNSLRSPTSGLWQEDSPGQLTHVLDPQSSKESLGEHLSKNTNNSQRCRSNPLAPETSKESKKFSNEKAANKLFEGRAEGSFEKTNGLNIDGVSSTSSLAAGKAGNTTSNNIWGAVRLLKEPCKDAERNFGYLSPQESRGDTKSKPKAARSVSSRKFVPGTEIPCRDVPGPDKDVASRGDRFSTDYRSPSMDTLKMLSGFKQSTKKTSGLHQTTHPYSDTLSSLFRREPGTPRKVGNSEKTISHDQKSNSHNGEQSQANIVQGTCLNGTFRVVLNRHDSDQQKKDNCAATDDFTQKTQTSSSGTMKRVDFTGALYCTSEKDEGSRAQEAVPSHVTIPCSNTLKSGQNLNWSNSTPLSRYRPERGTHCSEVSSTTPGQANEEVDDFIKTIVDHFASPEINRDTFLCPRPYQSPETPRFSNQATMFREARSESSEIVEAVCDPSGFGTPTTRINNPREASRNASSNSRKNRGRPHLPAIVETCKPAPRPPIGKRMSRTSWETNGRRKSTKLPFISKNSGAPNKRHCKPKNQGSGGTMQECPCIPQITFESSTSTSYGQCSLAKDFEEREMDGWPFSKEMLSDAFRANFNDCWQRTIFIQCVFDRYASLKK